MRTMSYVWRALEKQLPEEIKEKIMRMRFCKDRKVTFVTNTKKIQELLMCFYQQAHGCRGKVQLLRREVPIVSMFFTGTRLNKKSL
jgi:hypothetical protein